MNNNIPTSFSPGSITLFFSPIIGKSPATTYSRGCSINLKQGVFATVFPFRKNQLWLNKKPLEMGAVRHVIQSLAPEPTSVYFETPLPLGCGFGVSAACCLSAAFAISKHYDLDVSRNELGLIAHEAEVIHKSGLGDVASQLCGGVVYRKCETGPLDVEKLLIKPTPLFYRVFNGIDTSKVLSSQNNLKMIAKKGEIATQWLQKHAKAESIDMQQLLARSHEFSKETELLVDTEICEMIRKVNETGGQATMIMLGQAVLATMAHNVPPNWTECIVDQEGARWLP
jgi:pantoate kinase